MASITSSTIAATALRSRLDASPQGVEVLSLLASATPANAADVPIAFSDALGILTYAHHDRELLLLANLAVSLDLIECATRLAVLADDVNNSSSRVDLLLLGAALASNPSLPAELRHRVVDIGRRLELTTRQRAIFELSFDPDAVDGLTEGGRAYRDSRWPGHDAAAMVTLVVLVDDDSRPRDGHGWHLLNELVANRIAIRRFFGSNADSIDARWAPLNSPIITWSSTADFGPRSHAVLHVRGGDATEQVFYVLHQLRRLPQFRQLPLRQRLLRHSPTDELPLGDRVFSLSTVRAERERARVRRYLHETLLQERILLEATGQDPAALYDRATQVARTAAKKFATTVDSTNLDAVIDYAVTTALNDVLPAMGYVRGRRDDLA